MALLTPDQKQKAIQEALKAINKKYGDASISKLGDRPQSVVQCRSTGILAVDIALGIGGLPRGRIIEIFGPESSGKTTFCLSCIAEVQKEKGEVAFIDVEHALDPQYAKALGVKAEEIYISQPNSGEEALDILDTLLQSCAYDIIVVDSAAALVTKQELEGELGDVTVAGQARLLSKAMRKMTSIIARAGTTVIFTNQIREKVGVMFGSPIVTPGGKALKFYSSVRLDIAKTKQIKEGERVAGYETRIKVVKNKCAPPYTECTYEHYFDTGICKLGSLIDVALKFEIFQKKGVWYVYKGNNIGQGKSKTKELLKSDEALASEVALAVMQKLKSFVQEVTTQVVEEAPGIVSPQDLQDESPEDPIFKAVVEEAD